MNSSINLSYKKHPWLGVVEEQSKKRKHSGMMQNDAKRSKTVKSGFASFI